MQLKGCWQPALSSKLECFLACYSTHKLTLWINQRQYDNFDHSICFYWWWFGLQVLKNVYEFQTDYTNCQYSVSLHGVEKMQSVIPGCTGSTTPWIFLAFNSVNIFYLIHSPEQYKELYTVDWINIAVFMGWLLWCGSPKHHAKFCTMYLFIYTHMSFFQKSCEEHSIYH